MPMPSENGDAKTETTETPKETTKTTEEDKETATKRKASESEVEALPVSAEKIAIFFQLKRSPDLITSRGRVGGEGVKTLVESGPRIGFYYYYYFYCFLIASVPDRIIIP